METLESDTLCFLDASPGVTSDHLKSGLRHVNMSPKGHSSTVQAAYFAQLDKSLLKQIQNKYWPDFLLYGYDLEPFTKLLTKD